MWEIDLIVNYRNRKYLFYIKENIIKCPDYHKDGIFAIIRKNNTAILSIAIKNISNTLKQAITNLVAESIVFSEKENYIAKKKLPNFNNFKSTLLKAISLINIKEDINLVKSRLDIEQKVINFHSFFSFCLHDLKEKWNKEFSILIPHDNLIDDSIILDILTNIIESNITNTSITIDYINNKYILQNKEVDIPAQDETDILANLIILSPAKIIINCKNKISKDSYILLSYLFKDKLI